MFKDWRVFIFRRNRCSASPEYAEEEIAGIMPYKNDFLEV
jgi:hypothetical protein